MDSSTTVDSDVIATSLARGRPGISAREAEAARSDAIAIARVLCICGIVYVHAWTGLDIDALRAQGSSAHAIFYWTLIELIGRSSVPLLSIISGWLVASSVAKRSYGTFAKGKAKSLLLPMVIWNAISVGLVLLAASYGHLKAPHPGLGLPLLNEFLHLTAPAEINVQNAFLRDMFICMLAAPLLVRLPSRAIAGLLFLVGIWSIGGWQLYVLLRPQILLFFLMGILLRRAKADAMIANMPLLPAAAAFLLLGGIKSWLSIWGQHHIMAYPEASAMLDNGLRLVAALLFWRLSFRLARSPLGEALKRCEPYTFILFCSHVMVIWLVCPMIGPLFGRFGEPGYPLFLLLQPVMTLGFAIAIGQMLMKLWPAAARIMSGGRLTPA